MIVEGTIYCPNPESYYEDIFKTLTNVTKAYFEFALANEAFYRLTMANLSMPRSGAVFEVVQKYHYANLKGKDKQLTWSFIGGINAYIGLTFNGFADCELD